MGIIQIIKGHVYQALNINEPLMKYRIENGCKKCYYAYKNGAFNGQCNAVLGGCGCIMGAKSRVPNSECPFGVWKSDWFKPEVLEEINKRHKFSV